MSPSRDSFRVPTPLTPGARIRLIAPCGVVDRERFWKGLSWLERMGWRPVFDEGIFAHWRYHAGPDERRLAELQTALDDLDAQAIWVVRGGYGATRLLPHLDRRTLARRPRWLVGFSDATALHALWARAGIASLHGPNLSTIGTWSPEALAAVYGWLTGEQPPPLSGRLVRGESRVEAPLVGGNVSVLAAMVGTGFLPPTDGCLLFLEDLDEAPYRLDRALTQLTQAGVLDRVAGLIVGQLTNCGATYDEALDVILRAADERELPVLADLPVGHERTANPVPLGLPVGMDATSLSWPR